MELLTLLILSYLTGSIPTSIIISRLVKNIDIREYGSGNAGATNVYRILGWKYALIV
ncbi:MAG: glycerol-3-phosphate acyltransferase, partial [Candidatus Neomarinimicrobiota bacterium]|nr:glycerol-3-phosphate acyltransferase [Candidatus Neomarinimicrobiota bacterium]